MAGSANRSHSDIEVLQSNSRGKLIVLGAIVAVAGAAYWMSRGGPIGQPEEASSIMIVTQGSYHFRHEMEEYGFKVLEQRADAFVAKAHEVMPELAKDEVDGVAAIMKLADYGGYGYVAFENPATVDFSGIEVEGGIPTFEPHQRFAVISAGDLAFPHHISVTAERSELVPGIDLDLLTALFAQKELKAALTEDPESGPSTIVLRNTLESAIERVEAIEEAERTVAKILESSRKLLEDEERGEPKPTLLGGLSESVMPFALADGGVLLASRAANFTSRNGLSADLDLEETWRFTYQPAGGGERQACAGIFGGEHDPHGLRVRFREAPSGDALLIQTGVGAAELFTLDVGAGPCAFTDRGAIPPLARRGDDPGTPHRSGWVARARHEGVDQVDAVVELVQPGDEPPLDLLRSTRLGLGDPVWLDADHLAIVVSYRQAVAGQSLLLLSRSHPGVALEIGPDAIAGSYNVLAVAAVPGSEAAPRLVVSTAGPHSPRLFRVDLPAALPALFDELLADAPPPPESGDVQILTVNPERLTTTPLTEEGSVADPVVSADGRWVAFVVSNLESERDNDYEVGVAPLSGEGGQRLLTRNGLDDHAPVFSGDSKRVIFKTKYPIERTTWTLTTGRALPVE